MVKYLLLWHNKNMAKIVIYDSTITDKKFFKQLQEEHDVVYISEPIAKSNIIENADVISVFISSKVDKEIVNMFKKLKLIACRSTGYNNIDIKECSSRKITVVNVPTYGEHTVAEYTFTLILALSRRLVNSIGQVQQGEIDSHLARGIDLYGKKIGIVGLGRIGRNVAKLANAFGMSVLVYDPFVGEQSVNDIDIKLVELDELLRSSNIVTVHTPLNSKNKHLFDAKMFAQMIPGSLFINTARGELMVTGDLIEAIKSGHLAGAGIDVLEGENLVDINEEEILLKKGRVSSQLLKEAVANNLLAKLPNVIVTAHNAYNTKEAIERINQTTIDNITQFFNNSTQNIVS